jgi:hypothetical protein
VQTEQLVGDTNGKSSADAVAQSAMEAMLGMQVGVVVQYGSMVVC